MDWMKVLDNGLDVAKVIAGTSPIGAVLTIADAIVETKTKGVGIDNNEVIEMLEVLSKSSHNKIDDKFLCMAKAYLECEKK